MVVVRPAKIDGAVPAVDSNTTCPVAGEPLGPSSCQLVPLPPGNLPIALAAFAAASCCAGAIESAG